jgi:phosphatidylglycerophosphate synthase
VIDSPLDRAFHRRLSAPISRAALARRITPNELSLASLLAGTAAAWCFWVPAPTAAVAGLLLYIVAVVLDHADGEVARLSLTESRVGEWLDIAVDTVVHVLIALAMGATTAKVADPLGLWLGAIAALGFTASAIVAKTSPVPASADRIGTLLVHLGTRDGFYLMLIAFAVALAFAPVVLPILMMVVALGAHGYWLGRLAHRLARRAPPKTERNPK